MCLALGICTSLYFMFSIQEVRLTEEAKKYDREYKALLQNQNASDTHATNVNNKSEDTTNSPMEAKEVDGQAEEEEKLDRTWKDWLKEPTFYIHGTVYMLVRVAVNVTMTMQPFYLVSVTKFETTEENPTPVELAEVPLFSYIISLIFSLFLMQRMTRALRNRFLPMLVAIVVISITSFPMAFLQEESRNWIYVLAGFQGVGLAIMLNTATSMISDVIGNDSENSAFVYGCYSLFDKFANGGILLWIVGSYSEDEQVLRYIMSVTPIVCAVLAYIFTWIGNKFFSHKLAKITGVK
uniref:Uncharacterized protein n=1 Tax=Strombidium rassoulzadegani TaxID=1082188 RepID=A0A7S3CI56_9SPIT|mmetsp:Transcript_11019/g.18417  ORF Transcript_11019/g.18417 Transcript_11019/m.18417 type:complete len:295 (+) Transcript_11019:641-1525(+)